MHFYMYIKCECVLVGRPICIFACVYLDVNVYVNVYLYVYSVYVYVYVGKVSIDMYMYIMYTCAHVWVYNGQQSPVRVLYNA